MAKMNKFLAVYVSFWLGVGPLLGTCDVAAGENVVQVKMEILPAFGGTSVVSQGWNSHGAKLTLGSWGDVGSLRNGILVLGPRFPAGAEFPLTVSAGSYRQRLFQRLYRQREGRISASVERASPRVVAPAIESVEVLGKQIKRAEFSRSSVKVAGVERKFYDDGSEKSLSETINGGSAEFPRAADSGLGTASFGRQLTPPDAGKEQSRISHSPPHPRAYLLSEPLKITVKLGPLAQFLHYFLETSYRTSRVALLYFGAGHLSKWIAVPLNQFCSQFGLSFAATAVILSLLFEFFTIWPFFRLQSYIDLSLRFWWKMLWFRWTQRGPLEQLATLPGLAGVRMITGGETRYRWSLSRERENRGFVALESKQNSVVGRWTEYLNHFGTRPYSAVPRALSVGDLRRQGPTAGQWMEPWRFGDLIPIYDLKAVQVRFRLVTDGRENPAQWTASLADLYYHVPINSEVAGSWRRQLRRRGGIFREVWWDFRESLRWAWYFVSNVVGISTTKPPQWNIPEIAMTLLEPGGVERPLGGMPYKKLLSLRWIDLWIISPFFVIYAGVYWVVTLGRRYRRQERAVPIIGRNSET